MPKLYESFLPQSYLLAVNDNTSTNQFDITLKIIGKKLGRPSKRITLSQKGLIIKSATARRFGKNILVDEISIDRINKHRSFEQLRLHSLAVLYPGNYELLLNYTLPATKENKLLLENLNSSTNKTEAIRTIMPCVDEPEAWKNAKIEVEFK